MKQVFTIFPASAGFSPERPDACLAALKQRQTS